MASMLKEGGMQAPVSIFWIPVLLSVDSVTGVC